MSVKTGYIVRYKTLALLSSDHEEYITHGGLVIPKRGKLPTEGARVMVRIEVPSGAYFEMPSQIVRLMPGMGFVVAFEPEARSNRVALDELMVSPEFTEMLENEGPATGPQKQVILMDPTLAPPPQPTEPAKPRPSMAPDARPTEPVGAGRPSMPSPTAPAAAPLAAGDSLDGDTAEDPPASSTDDDGPAFKMPEPGQSYPVYAVKLATLLDLVALSEDLQRSGRLPLPVANDPGEVGVPAQVRCTLPGRNTYEMWGVLVENTGRGVVIRIQRDDPQLQTMLAYPRTTKGQRRLATEVEAHRRPIEVLRLQQERSGEDLEKMPLRRRLQRMGMDDKINLALSGGREERMALAQDGNKAIHHYLLKNARISLEEIAFMARLPTLNPDVLNKIGENPAYTQNPQVVRNLVFNPRTPPKLAVRLVDRLSRSDLQQIARRTSMSRVVVSAAQKRLGRGRR